MPTLPSIIPPIADENHNGVLDGQDIIAQLQREAAQLKNGERSVNDRAHGVLETLDARSLSTSLAQEMYKASSSTQLDKSVLTNDALKQFADDLTNRLNKTVQETNAAIQHDPQFVQHRLAKLTADVKLSHPHEAEVNLRLADGKSTLDFALTAAKSFPKGIKIEPQDIKEILEYFSIPISTPVTQPVKQTLTNTAYSRS